MILCSIFRERESLEVKKGGGVCVCLRDGQIRVDVDIAKAAMWRQEIREPCINSLPY